MHKEPVAVVDQEYDTTALFWFLVLCLMSNAFLCFIYFSILIIVRFVYQGGLI